MTEVFKLQRHFKFITQIRDIAVFNMKSLVVFASLVAVVLSAPPRHATSDEALRFLPAIRHEEVHDEFGQYALRYITAENTVVSERGRLVPSKNGGYVLEIEGRYSFIGDDGKVYVTKYRGGADGFHVDAAHLPQPVLPVSA